jgi:hypothetical protein
MKVSNRRQQQRPVEAILFSVHIRFDVRYWPKADRESAFAVAIRGKADIAFCGAHVCF